MQRAILLGLIGLLMSGCKHSDTKGARNEPRPTAANRKNQPTAQSSPKIIPLNEIKGKVASVTPELGIVVIDFNFNQIPKAEERMHVYRRGQKVGEVKISREAVGSNVAADVMAGEVKVGDEVRAN